MGMTVVSRRFHHLALVLFLLASCASVNLPSPQRFIYSPYKHVNQGLDATTLVISGPMGAYAAQASAPALTWAFATGECGQETWGGVDAERFARANVPMFERAGIGYIVSTGGEGGSFTCSSEAGMEAFIRRYASTSLKGVDFDIEHKQTPTEIDALVRSVKAVRGRYPGLRFSFTLATHAAADGSHRSLNALGETVLSTIKSVGLRDFHLNLMVMNYGPAQAAYCVTGMPEGCDMGRSAERAAENVHLRYGIPYRQIELTPMLGENDVVGNVFRSQDVDVLARFVRRHGLGGVHYWSLDRDFPCPANSVRVSARCTGVDAPAGAFRRRFEAAFR